MLDRPNRTQPTLCEEDAARAYREADAITSYWINQGYYGIKTEVIYTPIARKHAPAWGVRSNIGPNGFPPRQ